jgi:hypothetical protein
LTGHPRSREHAKAERISVAAKLASDIMMSGKRLEAAVNDGMRFALCEARLIYIEGEYVSEVYSCIEAALLAAFQTKSESEIADVIEECISTTIDAHLRKLAASFSTQ